VQTFLRGGVRETGRGKSFAADGLIFWLKWSINPLLSRKKRWKPNPSEHDWKRGKDRGRWKPGKKT